MICEKGCKTLQIVPEVGKSEPTQPLYRCTECGILYEKPKVYLPKTQPEPPLNR